jgi:hypothetical protein
MKIKQWMEKRKTESNGEWLSRRPKLTQGCSTERMDGWIFVANINSSVFTDCDQNSNFENIIYHNNKQKYLLRRFH